jgi:hypothetical protein
MPFTHLPPPPPPHRDDWQHRPDLNLVLVHPQIPQNAGNVARTCAATRVALHLVEPLGFELDDKKLKRAGGWGGAGLLLLLLHRVDSACLPC